MKTIKLEVFNGTTQFVNSFEVHQATGDKKIIGSSINRLFEFNSRLKKYGASHFKANQDLSVVISADGDVLMDTYTLNAQYGFKLRFGNTAKSKRKFASCLNDLITWAASDVKLLTLDDLVKELAD